VTTADSESDSGATLEEFNAEFLKVLPQLYRRAMFLIGASRAEDAVHDAYLKLSARPERLVHHPEPYAYAFAAVLSAIRDSMRRTGRQIPVGQVPDHLLQSAGHIELRENELDVARLLGRLSIRQAAVVLLVDVDGYTIDQAAAMLNVHRGTVTRMRNRALAALRKMVKADGSWEPEAEVPSAASRTRPVPRRPVGFFGGLANPS
jgi:RNA polymerase sigma factor (sigma-70 family)